MKRNTKQKQGNWSSSIKKVLKAAFKDSPFTLKFGDGWLNIARPDGVHCEFYPCGEDGDFCYLTATYVVAGKEQDIDVCIPDDTDEFLDIVSDILV